MDVEETPVPLPSAPKVALDKHIYLQPPLSRRGTGPGVIVIVPRDYAGKSDDAHSLDPPPLQKWAEEGYAVVEITTSADDSAQTIARDIQIGLDALAGLSECDNKTNFGFIGKAVTCISLRVSAE